MFYPREHSFFLLPKARRETRRETDVRRCAVIFSVRLRRQTFLYLRAPDARDGLPRPLPIIDDKYTIQEGCAGKKSRNSWGKDFGRANREGAGGVDSKKPGK
jgi:hypothetical protein